METDMETDDTGQGTSGVISVIRRKQTAVKKQLSSEGRQREQTEASAHVA